jgi:two-component system chemotaxis sensor kinase CheA
MELDLGRFRDSFFEEAAELLEELEAGLLRLERQTDDPDTLNAVFRAAHSIKGSAGMLDMGALMRFTHGMESLLDAMRSGDVGVDRSKLSMLLRASDTLRELVRWERQGGEAPAGVEPLERELTAALGSASGAAEAEPEPAKPSSAAWDLQVSPGAGTLRRGVEPLLLLRELDRLGRILSSEADLSRLPDLAGLDPLETYLSWRLRLETSAGEDAIRELLDWFGVEAELKPVGVEPVPGEAKAMSAAPARPPSESAASVRVAVDKIDQLVTLAGELAVAHSMASEVAGNFRPERWPELEMALAEIGRQVWLLQQSVMSVRMLPASDLFRRLPRLVHELEGITGKRLQLELEGEDAEIDKSVAERLADPLTHLVRNAADHGIESRQERIRAGKPEVGTIRIRALHEAGDVVLEITDDGKGLDAARIRAKAIERGLISAAAQMNERALYQLIFEPGFSTAAKVTSVSGRGVGMDVVRRNIEQLGGSIALNSKPGKGTQIRIRLPLTLAILDGLLVSMGRGLFLIPMAAIIKSIEPGTIAAVPGLAGMVLVDGQPTPLGVAATMLGLRTGSAAERPLAVIIQKDGRRAAIVVDELVGRQQVIVRNLEDHYRKVPGLLGASILGDGQVALILDPGWLLDEARGEAAAVELGGSR